MNKFKEWLSKGDGGYTPYEPYVTNKDLLCISIVTLILSVMIIIGCYLNKFYTL